jgi:nicotinamidase-related amidase
VLAVAHGDGAPLQAPDHAVSVTAAGIDAFYGGPLGAVLRRDGRNHLLVAGHGLEGPVHSTLRSANDRGFECLLVADASSPLTRDCAGAASSTVCMSGGIFGAVGDAGEVLAALAALPRFADTSLVSGGTP